MVCLVFWYPCLMRACVTRRALLDTCRARLVALTAPRAPRDAVCVSFFMPFRMPFFILRLMWYSAPCGECEDVLLLVSVWCAKPDVVGGSAAGVTVEC